MADLTATEKRYLEDLLGMGSGFVLELTNAQFKSLIYETVNLDIYSNKYEDYGQSKAKRLRAFWEKETNLIVGKVLKELLEVWKYEQSKESKTIDTVFFKKSQEIVNKLLGVKIKEKTEEDFLNIKFHINLSYLELDPQFENVISQRLNEIKKCLLSDLPLSVIFLAGSTLEGLLIEKASKNIKDFNSSKSAPKDKNGNVKKINEWTLSSLIDVAYELKYIELDIKKFSHDLRDFRNYIHPRVQAIQNFNPDKHTAEISWKVLQATIASLSGLRV